MVIKGQKKRGRKPSKNVIIKTVTRNNKTRKGSYFYVKYPKKRAVLLKIKEGVSIQDYLRASKYGLKNRKQGVPLFARTERIRLRDFYKKVTRFPK